MVTETSSPFQNLDTAATKFQEYSLDFKSDIARAREPEKTHAKTSFEQNSKQYKQLHFSI